MIIVGVGISARSNFEFMQRNDFAFFVRLSRLDSLANSIIATLSILTWLNILRYMRIIKDLGILFRVITKMASDVVIFISVFLVFVVSFALAFHMSIGHKVYDFRTWGYSILALIRMVVGDFDWELIEDTNVVFVRILFFVYLMIAAILLINLLIAMLNKSYSDVIQKAASEYELEFASIVLSYGQENTLTEEKILAKKKRKSAFFDSASLELQVILDPKHQPSTLNLIRKPTAVALKEKEELSVSTMETPHNESERNETLANSTATSNTDAAELPEEIEDIDPNKAIMLDIHQNMREMKTAQEDLSNKMRDMQKDMENSFMKKLKDVQTQLTELRKELKTDDELDFVYSDLF